MNPHSTSPRREHQRQRNGSTTFAATKSKKGAAAAERFDIATPSDNADAAQDDKLSEGSFYDTLDRIRPSKEPTSSKESYLGNNPNGPLLASQQVLEPERVAVLGSTTRLLRNARNNAQSPSRSSCSPARGGRPAADGVPLDARTDAPVVHVTTVNSNQHLRGVTSTQQAASSSSDSDARGPQRDVDDELGPPPSPKRMNPTSTSRLAEDAAAPLVEQPHENPALYHMEDYYYSPEVGARLPVPHAGLGLGSYQDQEAVNSALPSSASKTVDQLKQVVSPTLGQIFERVSKQWPSAAQVGTFFSGTTPQDGCGPEDLQSAVPTSGEKKVLPEDFKRDSNVEDHNKDNSLVEEDAYASVSVSVGEGAASSGGQFPRQVATTTRTTTHRPEIANGSSSAPQTASDGRFLSADDHSVQTLDFGHNPNNQSHSVSVATASPERPRGSPDRPRPSLLGAAAVQSVLQDVDEENSLVTGGSASEEAGGVVVEQGSVVVRNLEQELAAVEDQDHGDVVGAAPQFSAGRVSENLHEEQSAPVSKTTARARKPHVLKRIEGLVALERNVREDASGRTDAGPGASARGTTTVSARSSVPANPMSSSARKAKTPARYVGGTPASARRPELKDQHPSTSAEKRKKYAFEPDFRRTIGTPSAARGGNQTSRGGSSSSSSKQSLSTTCSTAQQNTTTKRSTGHGQASTTTLTTTGVVLGSTSNVCSSSAANSSSSNPVSRNETPRRMSSGRDNIKTPRRSAEVDNRPYQNLRHVHLLLEQRSSNSLNTSRQSLGSNASGRSGGGLYYNQHQSSMTLLNSTLSRKSLGVCSASGLTSASNRSKYAQQKSLADQNACQSSANPYKNAPEVVFGESLRQVPGVLEAGKTIPRSSVAPTLSDPVYNDVKPRFETIQQTPNEQKSGASSSRQHSSTRSVSGVFSGQQGAGAKVMASARGVGGPAMSPAAPSAAGEAGLARLAMRVCDELKAEYGTLQIAAVHAAMEMKLIDPRALERYMASTKKLSTTSAAPSPMDHHGTSTAILPGSSLSGGTVDVHHQFFGQQLSSSAVEQELDFGYHDEDRKLQFGPAKVEVDAEVQLSESLPEIRFSSRHLEEAMLDVFQLEDMFGNKRNCSRLFRMIERTHGERKGYIALTMLDRYTHEVVRKMERQAEQDARINASATAGNKPGVLVRKSAGEKHLSSSEATKFESSQFISDELPPAYGEGVQRYSQDLFQKSLRTGPSERKKRQQAAVSQPRVHQRLAAESEVQPEMMKNEDTSYQLSVIDEVDDDECLSSPALTTRRSPALAARREREGTMNHPTTQASELQPQSNKSWQKAVPETSPEPNGRAAAAAVPATTSAAVVPTTSHGGSSTTIVVPKANANMSAGGSSGPASGGVAATNMQQGRFSFSSAVRGPATAKLLAPASTSGGSSSSTTSTPGTTINKAGPNSTGTLMSAVRGQHDVVAGAVGGSSGGAAAAPKIVQKQMNHPPGVAVPAVFAETLAKQRQAGFSTMTQMKPLAAAPLLSARGEPPGASRQLQEQSRQTANNQLVQRQMSAPYSGLRIQMPVLNTTAFVMPPKP
ncbi:unnamed protein product [Amoebophrya sp. A120]|nr:unnamed protein product [Amoebophrya sp. A120]|eukprot:GSA120T00001372001.1